MVVDGAKMYIGSLSSQTMIVEISYHEMGAVARQVGGKFDTFAISQ